MLSAAKHLALFFRPRFRAKSFAEFALRACDFFGYRG